MGTFKQSGGDGGSLYTLRGSLRKALQEPLRSRSGGLGVGSLEGFLNDLLKDWFKEVPMISPIALWGSHPQSLGDGGAALTIPLRRPLGYHRLRK